MADRLSLAHAIESAEVARDAAEAIAGEIDEPIRESVATKADITLLRTELKSDIAAVSTKLESDIAAIRAELDLVRHQLVTRLGGLVVVVAGPLFAALHYWPPHS
jgi:hypothetical protein